MLPPETPVMKGIVFYIIVLKLPSNNPQDVLLIAFSPVILCKARCSMVWSEKTVLSLSICNSLPFLASGSVLCRSRRGRDKQLLRKHTFLSGRKWRRVSSSSHCLAHIFGWISHSYCHVGLVWHARKWRSWHAIDLEHLGPFWHVSLVWMPGSDEADMLGL